MWTNQATVPQISFYCVYPTHDCVYPTGDLLSEMTFFLPWQQQVRRRHRAVPRRWRADTVTPYVVALSSYSRDRKGQTSGWLHPRSVPALLSPWVVAWRAPSLSCAALKTWAVERGSPQRLLWLTVPCCLPNVNLTKQAAWPTVCCFAWTEVACNLYSRVQRAGYPFAR